MQSFSEGLMPSGDWSSPCGSGLLFTSMQCHARVKAGQLSSHVFAYYVLTPDSISNTTKMS